MAGEMKRKGTQCKVAHSMLTGECNLVDKRLSLTELILKNKGAYFGQFFLKTGAVVVMRTSCPKCLLVQLQRLVLRSSVNHCSHTGVSDGECLYPYAGGTIVP